MEDERRWAERVIAAFEAAGKGTMQLDGVMLDTPHLAQARRIIASWDRGQIRQRPHHSSVRVAPGRMDNARPGSAENRLEAAFTGRSPSDAGAPAPCPSR